MKKTKIIASIFSLVVLGGALVSPVISEAQTTETCVVLYEHINYKGKSQLFCGSYQYVGKDWNNKASSARFTIKKGKEVVLFDKNYKQTGRNLGIVLSKSGSIPDFRKTHGINFNDRVSSILVEDQ